MLKDAVVAVEDRDFYKHGGVDVRGSLRALVADIRNEKTVQGGSTITQQYVKMAYTGGARTLSRKVARGDPGQPDRPADLQGRDPVPLPLDHLPGRRQLRRRGGRRELLPQAGQPAHRVRGGHAGRAHPRSEPLGAPGEPGCRRESHREFVLDKMLQQGYLTPAAARRGHGAEGVVAGQGPGRRPRPPSSIPPETDPTEVSGVRRLRRALPDRQVRRRGGRSRAVCGSRRRSIPRVQAAADSVGGQRAGRHLGAAGDGAGRRSSRRPASSMPSSAAGSSARAPSPTSTWRSAAATSRRPGGTRSTWRPRAGTARR